MLNLGHWSIRRMTNLQVAGRRPTQGLSNTEMSVERKQRKRHSLQQNKKILSIKTGFFYNQKLEN